MDVQDYTFYNVIRRNSICFKNRYAWFEVADRRSITYMQYKDMVDRVASGLQKLGVVKGDRIGIIGKNGLEYFIVYGAAAALGAIVLPINWRLSAEEIVFNLDDCTPKIVFADREYEDLIFKQTEKVSYVKELFSLGQEEGKFCDFKKLLNNEASYDHEDLSSDDGFVIIHTAAVGGRPKGALLSHANLLSTDMHLGYSLSLKPEDCHLNVLPLFHVGGLCAVTATFHAGALNVNMKKFDSAKASELIDQKQVSLLFEFAPILSLIMDEAEKSGSNLSSLRAVVGLDNAETIKRYQRLTGGSFYNLYGQTEVSAYVSIGRYDQKPGSAGKALPLTEVSIVDENDRPLGVGEIGEIVAKGPVVFKGYWGLPDENAYTFRNGWHHTGDLGRFDEDGFLWYEGRKTDKELIKPGGENVYPAEVESAILLHPAVEYVVVFGVPDPKWREGIKAVCQLKCGHSLDPHELIQFVEKRIARYKRPQYVEFVSNFPLLQNGLPDREKIKRAHGGHN